MKFRTRDLARAGAATLLASGVLAALATPALAAAPAAADLSLDVVGLTVAANASGKDSVATIRNLSKTNVATGVVFAFSLGNLDASKVDLSPVKGDKDCKKQNAVGNITAGGPFIVCAAGDVKPGENLDWPFQLVRKAGATGKAGVIGFSVVHDGADPNEKNNTKALEVNVGGSGVDIQVVAPDVYADVKKDGVPVKPGTKTKLWVWAGNYGDQTAKGIAMTIKLPKGATLADPEPDCKFSADKTSATCNYANLTFLPADQDKDKNSEKDGVSAGWFYFLIDVAKDAKAPALRGGVAAAKAVTQLAPEAARTSAVAPTVPANFTLAAPVNAQAVTEVDARDNIDEFSVIVAKPAPGGTGGGGKDKDPILPVTGVQAGLIGGGGLAVLVAGGVLFLAARRRRVVLVTPGDEKTPTA